MKKAILLFVFTSSLLTVFSQVRKAAIGFLYTQKNEITYYGMVPQVVNPPKSLFSNGSKFTEEIYFDSIKTKIKSILPALGFRLVSEDSIITKESYKNLIKKNAPDKTPNDVLANGYAYAANFGLLFNNDGTDPDVMIEAYGDYTLDLSNLKGSVTATLVYQMTIVGYNSKKKKVFVFKTKNNAKNPTKIQVAIKQSNSSPWGYEIIEDISQKQIDCLQDAFKRINEDLPEQIEKTNKFYTKEK